MHFTAKLIFSFFSFLEVETVRFIHISGMQKSTDNPEEIKKLKKSKDWKVLKLMRRA